MCLPPGSSDISYPESALTGRLLVGVCLLVYEAELTPALLGKLAALQPNSPYIFRGLQNGEFSKPADQVKPPAPELS